MTNRWLALCLALLPVFISPSLSGQGDPLLRVEIETRSDEARYRMVPCGEPGAMMFYRTTVREDEGGGKAARKTHVCTAGTRVVPKGSNSLDDPVGDVSMDEEAWQGDPHEQEWQDLCRYDLSRGGVHVCSGVG